MRFLIICFSALLIASCGTGKVRFVRTNHFEKQKIVTVDELDRNAKVQDAVHVQEDRAEVRVTPEVSVETSMNEPKDDFHIPDFDSEKSIEELPTVVSDTLRTNEISDEEKVNTAILAEKRSIVALVSAILVYVCVLGALGLALTYWSPYIAISVLVISALVSFILSWVYQGLARRLQYTTERGRKILLAALILNIISSVALLVSLLFD